MFQLDYDDSSKLLNCKFSGRMDGTNTKEAELELNKKVLDFLQKEPELKITFDLSEVEYIASAFIRTCLATAKQLKENAFSIVNTNPLIKKTFKMAGLEEILNVN